MLRSSEEGHVDVLAWKVLDRRMNDAASEAKEDDGVCDLFGCPCADVQAALLKKMPLFSRDRP